jgi:acetyl-CoA carboxylase biotin carboxylase subunit
MFGKILIANRGEIALRVIRACKELSIKTVAVHSTADANSLHVKFADESICIGPAQSSQSYLNIPSIISAAEITDADAIHPGYGFLSENPALPEICQSCGIDFIGPTPENMRLMGNKVRAIKTMREAGVPVIEGSKGKINSAEEIIEIGDRIGYPVIIKAAAGGGGRGMRIVNKREEVQELYSLIKTETEAAFGDSSVYVEKYIVNPKHVEVQVLGDSAGNIIHLGERDCSIQRRHQKLIEESPCYSISQKTRKSICETAVKAAKSVNYISAGTIEFLMDSDENFYFIEMNTRIQVEHPVTEMVSGVDLVKEQIKIAAGEKINYTQDKVRARGHSIECRINAEDPVKFTPCPGKITALNIPGGPGVRVDTFIYSEYTVLPYYDSLIAKLIVHGSNREEAIAIMRRALDEFHIEGIKTTIPFHKKVFANKEFQAGKFSTSFIETLT